MRLDIVPGMTHLFEEPRALETVARLVGARMVCPLAEQGRTVKREGAMARHLERPGRAGSRMRRRKSSWVRVVRETSNVMDLLRDLFKRTPDGIARGLKRAVLQSRRTKGTKFQSAMSMLNLYVNRAGRTLPSRERVRLEAAKEELRKVLGRSLARRVSARGRPGMRRA